MPPKRKASYATRAAQRRRVEENNPHPSQLTAHSAARETSQSSTGANPPTAQGARSVNADWLANLGRTIAVAVQKSLQEAGFMVNNQQSGSQPEIQFIPDTPQSNNLGSRQQDGPLLTQRLAQAFFFFLVSSTHILQGIFSSWNKEKLCSPGIFVAPGEHSFSLF